MQIKKTKKNRAMQINRAMWPAMWIRSPGWTTGTKGGYQPGLQTVSPPVNIGKLSFYDSIYDFILHKFKVHIIIGKAIE
jgi:hypothetical protein